jgi:hypothetical protein
LLIGLPVGSQAPTATGVVTSYGVVPSLPAGLSFSATTGVISGTPTTATPNASYTITASNISGSTTFDVSLGVVPLAIQARADVKAVEITWPTGTGATFNLFRAEAPSCNTANYSSCPGGTLVTNVTPAYRNTGLTNGTSYWFRLEANANGVSVLSNEAPARPDQLTTLTVSAIAAGADGTVYLGGEFQSIGVRTGSGVVVDTDSGAPGAFPFVDGNVFAAVSDGADGWYIGGDFLTVGGKPRSRLAHIRADMSVGDWNPSVGPARYQGGTVRSLALVGSTLYVGGGFTEVNGVARDSLAAVGTDGTLLPAVNPTFAGTGGITRLTVAGDTIYVGGSFTSVNGQPRSHLAAIGTDGTLRAWNPGTDGDVWGISVVNNVVYIGGVFTTLGGAPRRNLGAVGASSGTVTSWAP